MFTEKDAIQRVAKRLNISSFCSLLWIDIRVAALTARTSATCAIPTGKKEIGSLLLSPWKKRVPKGSARMIRSNVNAAIRSGRRSHCYGNMKVAMRVMATKLGLIEQASNPTEVFGSPHVDSTIP